MPKKNGNRIIKPALLLLSLFFIVALLVIISDRHTDKETKYVFNETRELAAYTTALTTTETAATTTTYAIPHISAPICKTAVLYCIEDDEILYGYNVNGRMAPASITKLLTAATALKYMEIDDEITVGTELELVKEGSSLCFIRSGGKSSLENFLYGLFLPSGNDAAYTIAVSVARKCRPELEDDKEAVEYFCELMNELADEIGMKKSHFENPDGWDSENHYTTAIDLIKLAQYSIFEPEICEIAGTFKANVEFDTGEVYQWQNSNRLIDPDSDFYCEDVFGLKTGTTGRSGRSIVAAFKHKGKTYISVVIGCSTDENRYELTLKMKDALN